MVPIPPALEPVAECLLCLQILLLVLRLLNGKCISWVPHEIVTALDHQKREATPEFPQEIPAEDPL